MNLTTSLTGEAANAIRDNTMSSMDLASNYVALLGLGACMLFLFSIIFWPKIIRRLIVGYVLLTFTGFVLFVLKILFDSLGSISRALWFEWFTPLGQFLIDYWLLILVSLPLAYFVGVKGDKMLMEEILLEETKKEVK